MKFAKGIWLLLVALAVFALPALTPQTLLAASPSAASTTTAVPDVPNPPPHDVPNPPPHDVPNPPPHF